MIKSILLEGPLAQDTGVFTLQLDRKIEVKIPAEEARRKVNQFVHLELSTQMRAETPTLVVGDQTLWRVPVHLTYPSFGDVGCVGYIEVHPITSHLNTTLATIEDIKKNAENLARRFTSSAKG